MMKSSRFICGLILLTAVCQCNQYPQKSQNPILGFYDLTAHDNSGLLVFTGTLQLEALEHNHLKGQCTIAGVKNAPQTVFDESGPCEASLEGKTIDFDLAPFMDDAGLLLEGELDDGRITGVWKRDGFFTSEVLGRFQAVKRRD
jgi:hypothetical protein